MKKYIPYVNYAILALGVAAALIVEIVIGFNETALYTTLLIFLGLAVFESLMVLLQEAKDLNKDDNLAKASLVASIFLVVFTTGEYYALKYISYEDTYFFIFWIVLVVGIIGTVVCLIISYRVFKKKNKKPKFIVNNRK